MQQHSRIVLIIIFFVAAQCIPVLAAPSRLALVIGNANYEKSPLDNPVNDAQDMADVLQKLGFDVMLKTNVDRRAMITAMQDFGQRLQNGGVALFYFSGHGLQSQNLNYLLPLKANIKSEADVEFEAVNASRIVAQMEQANERGVNLIFLDACRDNPYKSYMKGSSAGLARMDSPMGTLIAYATAPGTVAYGEGRERNSIYTKHLLAALRETPSVSITELLITVRNRVIKDTQRQQVPWESVSLTQQFCFGECGKSQQPAEIAQLLHACEQHFQAGRLTSGRGGTALECYEEVLKRDPANADALAGLNKIEAKYAEWAQQAIERGQKAKAQQYLASLRLVNPESEQLAQLEGQLYQPTPLPSSTPLRVTPTASLTAIPTPLPTSTPTPTPPIAQPAVIRLRSQPATISSRDEAKRVFKLDGDRRPLNYIENQFEDQGEVVIDHATGLIWEKSGSNDSLVYPGAQAYIDQLNRERFGGYNDWRLPTIEELLSLMTKEKQANGLYINPIFDGTQSWCWSADKGSSELAWLVDFDRGLVHWTYLVSGSGVRGVRSK